jgi:hypothetical protein
MDPAGDEEGRTVSGTLLGAPGAANGIFQSKLRHRFNTHGSEPYGQRRLLKRKRFYEWGCQEQTPLHLEEGLVFLGIQPPAD